MSKRDDFKKIEGNILASTSTGPAPLFKMGSVPVPARMQGVSRAKQALEIELDRIERDPDQPRKEFDQDALERLADSLKSRGQLQPIRVRWDEGRGAYVVLVGERRWRAARLAGLASLACVVDEGELSADEKLAVQLVENALREDLRPVEQARAYRALMDAKGWSGNQLAKELHVPQSAVSRALSLLDLPEAVQHQVDAGQIAATTAVEIARVPGPAAQEEIAAAVVEEGLTGTRVADLVRAVRTGSPVPGSRPGPVTFDLEGASVRIIWKKGGEGLSALQIARRLVKLLQERERGEAAA